MFRSLTKLFGAAGVLITAPMIYTKSKDKPKKTATYIWGNGYYQARPDALLQFKNFEPKLIKNFSGDKSLKLLRFSPYFEAGIDIKGNLLIWPSKALDSNLSETSNDNIRQNIQQLEKDIVDVRFTQGFVWALNSKGEVYQWQINKPQKKEGSGASASLGQKRHVKPFQNIQQVTTGQDHIVVLNNKGEVYAMGDDTEGQCGQPGEGRLTCPPFPTKRVTSPQQVKDLPKIKKIVSGGNHTLAIDQAGNLYGWGSNCNMQLSHEEQFSKGNGPMLCSFNPIKISRNLSNHTVENAAAGGEFSIITTTKKQDKNSEAMSFGNNLKGQLGISLNVHVRDVSIIDNLSNFVITENGQEQKVYVEQIQCGKNHCIALMNIGYVFEWGDNEYGQMGNKRRASLNEPTIVKEFMKKPVLGVFASENSTGVIVEQE